MFEKQKAKRIYKNLLKDLKEMKEIHKQSKNYDGFDRGIALAYFSKPNKKVKVDAYLKTMAEEDGYSLSDTSLMRDYFYFNSYVTTYSIQDKSKIKDELPKRENNGSKANNAVLAKSDSKHREDKRKSIASNYDKLKTVKKIAESLNLKLRRHYLKKIESDHFNSFEISDNLIYLYPLNDGFPTCGFEFYKDGRLVISNNEEYSQISNLDDILLQMVRAYDQSLDNKIVLDPYYFMLELTDEVCGNYHGSANLVITEKAIRNQVLNERNFDEANKCFINHFLDHFMGWNFGLSINRNETLKKELEQLNQKVIDMGIREYAGTGFEVYGGEDEVHDGLQHYSLPTEKQKTLKLSRK